MQPNITINFVDPSPLPAKGFTILYRPKGSLQTYFTKTSLTGSPIKITENILANVDYEVIIKSNCDSKNSIEIVKFTNNYNNVVGNVNIINCVQLNAGEAIETILFKDVNLL